MIDEKVRDIVVKIFNMYVNGSGSKTIVKYLNDNHYLSPRGYKKCGVVKDDNNTEYLWNSTSLCGIIRNEAYIGNTIQHKVSIVSYKVKKLRKVDKEEHIRVNDTHEAIIDKDVFENAQRIQEINSKRSEKKYDYLFKGLIFCKHCNRKMQIALKKNVKRKAEPHPYIIDTESKIRGCYARNLNYYNFEEKMIDIIRKICKIYADKNELEDTYKKFKNNNIDMSAVIKKQIYSIEVQQLGINRKLDQLYDDKLNRILPETDFMRISQRYIKERDELEVKNNDLKEQLMKIEQQKVANDEADTETLNKLIVEFLKMKNISKTILYKLIDKIEIDKDKNIFITFNFSGLNIISDNIDEFVEIEKVLEKGNQKLKQNVG